jgi:hypothetical protein
MVKHLLAWSISSALFLVNTQAYSFTVTYKLEPKHSLVLTNTTGSTLSAYCLINAVANVTSSISIAMLRGAGLFNGSSMIQGQTLYQDIYNSQYIPLTANGEASARFTNIGTYAVQAQCSLDSLG